VLTYDYLLISVQWGFWDNFFCPKAIAGEKVSGVLSIERCSTLWQRREWGGGVPLAFKNNWCFERNVTL